MIKDNFKGRNNSTDESEIEGKVVTVGSNQGHKALMVIIVVMLVGIVYYFYLSPSNKENSEVINKEKKEVKQNILELKDKLEQVPDDIPIPERIVINPLPPLPPIVEPKTIPEIKSEVKQTKKEEEKPKEILPGSNIPPLPKKHDSITNNFPTSFPTIISDGYPKERRNVQMLAISGDAGSENKAADVNTSAQQGKATKMDRLDFMIAQGKVIDAILETAISVTLDNNLDKKGDLRAMVSRDVYAEVGNAVLIPKGSRLIGTYTYDPKTADDRVDINWNRVILPSHIGIDIAIASPGTNELGRAGIYGVKDNRTVSSLFSSVLLAGTRIGAAIIGQRASNLIGGFSLLERIRSISSNEISLYSLKNVIDVPDNKSSRLKLSRAAIERLKSPTSEDDLLDKFKQEVKRLNVGNEALIDQLTLEDIKQLLKEQGSKSIYERETDAAISKFSMEMEGIISRNLGKPSLHINQGTALKVFVKQDIVLPPQAVLYYR